MSKSDLIRLRHMLEAASEAVRFAEGHTPSDLSRNPVWAVGLVKCVEIVGEAAAGISGEGKAECPHIPWAPIVAMRNRLVHVYFDVDLDQIWKALTDDLPPLINYPAGEGCQRCSSEFKWQGAARRATPGVAVGFESTESYSLFRRTSQGSGLALSAPATNVRR